MKTTIQLVLVTASMLFTSTVMADDQNELDLKRLHIQTEEYSWKVDVHCRHEIPNDSEVIIRTQPKNINVDRRIIVQEKEGKRQACRVKQFAVVMR